MLVEFSREAGNIAFGEISCLLKYFVSQAKLDSTCSMPVCFLYFYAFPVHS